ncbi:serine hydrolase domain-containing protein [Lysobacter sp. A3-1-A15]|uniref:serine hydrolase domain-containing protein n=1 Tax=Novilysobacter viscosus TaxID=3098602 RepID=UPI002EDBA8B1
MKDAAIRRPRAYLRVGATALLLTLTLGSTAQTPGAGVDPSAVATVSTSSLDAAPPAAAPAPIKQPQIPLSSEFDARLFEAAAQQLVADQRVPGLAMAIVYNGRVLSARGYGITDVQAAEPVDAHTVFRLASLSKGFAGTLAGLLVNDGSIRWDSKLTQYLPEFRLRDPSAAEQITVADVLSHRVGLRHHSLDRDLEQYVDYRTLTRRLADAPLSCQPGTCYGYQNIAFSLIGDVAFAATGTFYSQAVQRRLFKPLGMNDASLGLEGIRSSPRWARPHVRTRGGWVSVTPKPTYYEVAPAAGVNASASDMAQWLIAQTGHRPDVLPAPLLATLHSPLVNTPGEMRSSAWRRERLTRAGYGLGWRVYDYAGHQLVYHGGAVQGYRGAIAMLPERDFGVAVLWNGESALPAGLLPSILDKAIGMSSGGRWLDVDFEEASLYVQSNFGAPGDNPGSNASRASASPE